MGLLESRFLWRRLERTALAAAHQGDNQAKRGEDGQEQAEFADHRKRSRARRTCSRTWAGAVPP